FDNVLDFDFSPDESTIAVTFGVVGCDYPGDAARIYQVSLPDLSLKPLSPPDRLSVKVHWTPNGNSLIYTNDTGSNASLMALDLRSGKITRLSDPGDNGPDYFVAWK